MERTRFLALLVVISVHLDLMASWYDDDYSLAGLTQGSHENDIQSISSDDEPIDPESNFRLLLEGAKALSNNISQISNFDDKVFQLSHGESVELVSQGGDVTSSGYISNSMASSCPVSERSFDVSFMLNL